MLDVGFFSGIDLFQHLPDSCLEALQKDSQVFDCKGGHLFYVAEQAGRTLFILEKGSVRTFRPYGDKRLTIATLRPPAIFGVLGCFGRGKYQSSAEALQPSRVRTISCETIQTLLECAPHLANKFVDLMSERLAHFLHSMETLARKGLIPRLATLLLEREENGVVAGMTHQELANNLGLHRETVTSTLGELRTAGIIEIKRKTIFILQRERLERATHE